MPERLLIPALRSLPCVRRVKALPSADAALSQVELECSTQENDRGNPQTQLFNLLCGLDAPLYMLTPVRDTLEDVFLRATAEETTEGA